MRALIGPRISRSEGELCPPKSIGECGLGLARGGKKREHNRHARETGKRAANFNALLHT